MNNLNFKAKFVLVTTLIVGGGVFLFSILADMSTVRSAPVAAAAPAPAPVRKPSPLGITVDGATVFPQIGSGIEVNLTVLNRQKEMLDLGSLTFDLLDASGNVYSANYDHELATSGLNPGVSGGVIEDFTAPSGLSDQKLTLRCKKGGEIIAEIPLPPVKVVRDDTDYGRVDPAAQ